jgi:diacylglycerol kinase
MLEQTVTAFDEHTFGMTQAPGTTFAVLLVVVVMLVVMVVLLGVEVVVLPVLLVVMVVLLVSVLNTGMCPA